MTPEPTSDSSVTKLQKQIEEFESNRGTSNETRLSNWIRSNQPLLTASGAITVAAGQAVAWLVAHAQEIHQFVEVIGRGFGSPPGIPALNLDAVRIFDERLVEVLPQDDPLFRAVAKQVASANGFARVVSEKYSLDSLVDEL
jgi:hypothetical protein